MYEVKRPWLWLGKKILSLMLGFALYALGNILTLYADLGMNPWGVFHMGISNHTPLTFGQASQVVGLVILLTSYALGTIPGIGSIGNMIFIGGFFDIIDMMNIIKTPETIWGQYIMLFSGIFAIGWGSLFYLRVNLGAGPRDGLMEGMVRKFKKPVWMIRNTIEAIALFIGYLLGGPVGIGTIITVLTIGFSVDFAFKVGRYDSKSVKHLDSVEVYKLFKDRNSINKIPVRKSE